MANENFEFSVQPAFYGGLLLFPLVVFVRCVTVFVTFWLPPQNAAICKSKAKFLPMKINTGQNQPFAFF